MADVASPGDEPPAFDDLPSEVDLHARLPAVRNQGARGTFVAHAVAAVREYLRGEMSMSAYFSEQYLHRACKARDGFAGASKWIRTAMEVLEELGVCPEPVWPYNGNVVP